MIQKKRALPFVLCALASHVLADSLVSTHASDELFAEKMPLVRTIDERFQSFQLGFSHLTGGHTWVSFNNMTPEMVKEREYTGDLSPIREPRAPTDLSNPRFIALASALSPLYIRFGGTTTNTVYFQDNDEPKLLEAPPGFESVLTRKRWREAVEFADRIGAKIYTGFSVGHGVRDENGVWTPIHAKPWLDYNRRIGGEIYAAELFNEPNMEGHSNRLGKDYRAQEFARDYDLFKSFMEKNAPETKLVGPSDVATGRQGALMGLLNTGDYLKADPAPTFDVISYHFYPALSDRCAPNPDSPMAITAEKALSEEYLARQDEPLHIRKALRDQYAPGAPIWNTETGGAACGGTRWQTSFLDTFRFLDTQARLAKQGLDAIFTHAILSGSNGVIDEKTFLPNANYWAALLWRKLMGTRVLEAGPIESGLHVYAHCERGSSRGGITLLAINLQDQTAMLNVSGSQEVYALTAPELQSKTVLLNGKALELESNDSLPEIAPNRRHGAGLKLEPTSVNFVVLPEAGNPVCAE